MSATELPGLGLAGLARAIAEDAVSSREATLAVADTRDEQAMLAQVALGQCGEALVVFDHQDLDGRLGTRHAAMLRRAARGRARAP